MNIYIAFDNSKTSLAECPTTFDSHVGDSKDEHAILCSDLNFLNDINNADFFYGDVSAYLSFNITLVTPFCEVLII